MSHTQPTEAFCETAQMLPELPMKMKKLAQINKHMSLLYQPFICTHSFIPTKPIKKVFVE